MTGEDFSAWLDEMGWTDIRAAAELEMSRNSVAKYRRQGAPRYVAYACAAIIADLPPWSTEGKDDGFVAIPRLKED